MSYLNENRYKNHEVVIKWSPYTDDDFILVHTNILFYHIFSYDGSGKEKEHTQNYENHSNY
jgi:hypothetical protein